MRRVPARDAFLLSIGLLMAGCADDARAPAPGLPAVLLERAADADGAAAEPVSVPALLPPTYAVGERRAWSLAALFGTEAAHDGGRLLVEQADGTQVRVDRPFGPKAGGVWVLRANRRGEAQLERVDPSSPFPAYHGRGGNRGRSGAPGERIEHVVRLRLEPGEGEGARPRGDLAPAREELRRQIEFLVDGVARSAAPEALAALVPVRMPPDGGRDAAEAWPVRALVRAVGGPRARLTAVRGRGGAVHAVAAVDGEAPGRVALLRLNRRGRFKLLWARPDGRPLAAEPVRDVDQLRLSTR